MLLSSAKGVRYESVFIVFDLNFGFKSTNYNLTESRLKVISKYIYSISLRLYKID